MVFVFEPLFYPLQQKPLDPLKSDEMQDKPHSVALVSYHNMTLSIERNPFSAQNQTLRSYRVYISPKK